MKTKRFRKGKHKLRTSKHKLRTSIKGGATLPFTPMTKEELQDAINKFKNKLNMAQNIKEYGKMDTWITTHITNMYRLFDKYKFDNRNDIVSMFSLSNSF